MLEKGPNNALQVCYLFKVGSMTFKINKIEVKCMVLIIWISSRVEMRSKKLISLLQVTVISLMPGKRKDKGQGRQSIFCILWFILVYMGAFKTCLIFIFFFLE